MQRRKRHERNYFGGHFAHAVEKQYAEKRIVESFMVFYVI